jgi:hypothetical protein
MKGYDVKDESQDMTGRQRLIWLMRYPTRRDAAAT